MNIGVLAPQQTTCAIQSNGTLKNAASTGVCTVWGNDVISPANTTYQVQFKPGNVLTNTVSQQCITGSTYSLNAPKFCPVTNIVPQYNTITTSPITSNIVPATPHVFTLGNAQAPYAAIYVDNIFGAGVGGAPQVTFPTGIPNGVLRQFTVPVANFASSTSLLFLNGTLVPYGSSTYTVTGSTINWLAPTPPQTGDAILYIIWSGSGGGGGGGGSIGDSDVTNQSASQGTTNLVAAVSSTGKYRISYYVAQNALCTTGARSVLLTFYWNDGLSNRIANSITLTLGQSQQLFGSVQGVIPIYASVSSGITYTSTVSGSCVTGGPSSYDAHIAVESIQ